MSTIPPQRDSKVGILLYKIPERQEASVCFLLSALELICKVECLSFQGVLMFVSKCLLCSNKQGTKLVKYIRLIILLDYPIMALSLFFSRTTLMYAVKSDSKHIVDLLLKRDIDVFFKDSFGWNAVRYAIMGNRKV